MCKHQILDYKESKLICEECNASWELNYKGQFYRDGFA